MAISFLGQKLICLVLSLLSVPALSATLYDKQLKFESALYAKLAKVTAPQVFVQSLSFALPKSLKTVSEIIYGNSDIGFFSSKNFSLARGKISLRLIPPTYLKPVEFWAVPADAKLGRKSLGKRKFTHPLVPNSADFARVLSKPSMPFVVFSWGSHMLPTVINRLGEIVWIFNPPPSSTKTWDGSGISILENGEFLFLRMDRSSLVSLVTSFGEVKYQISLAEREPHLPSSHTVQYLPKTKELVYLSYDCRELPAGEEFLAFFQGTEGKRRLKSLPRRSYRGGKLIRMSLETGVAKEIWNSFQTYSPQKNPSLAVGFLGDMDRFPDISSDERYLALLDEKYYYHWYDWPAKFCNVDWTHENSAQYIDGKGYLISVRNLNELLFLDENGKLLWRMGEGPGHDYNLPHGDDSFSMQHSPVMMEDGRIVLYDNHSPYRGFLGTRFGNRISILNPKKPGPLKPDWSFTIPSPHSDVCGSVTPLKNGKYFAFTAGNPGVPADIFEINPKTSKVEGHISYLVFGEKGFEAKPFYAFAGDKFIDEEGTKPPVESEESPDFLQFTY